MRVDMGYLRSRPGHGGRMTGGVGWGCPVLMVYNNRYTPRLSTPNTPPHRAGAAGTVIASRPSTAAGRPRTDRGGLPSTNAGGAIRM